MNNNLSSSSCSDDTLNDVSSKLSFCLKLNNSDEVGTVDEIESLELDKAQVSSNQGCKGLNKDYEFVSTYQSLILARKGILDKEIGNQLWTRGCSYSTRLGDKINYSCRGNPRCPKRVYFLLDPTSQDVHVYMSTDLHNHQRIFNKSSLNQVSKNKILELIACGVTQPKRLLKELEKNNLPGVSRCQINNLKQREQKKVIGPLTCSLCDFLLWVKKRESVPEDSDEVYVVDYNYKLSNKCPNKIKDMRCFMTTKRLVSQALKTDHVHIDGTYKVIWQAHTLIVAGTTDKSKKWHQLGVMTTKREKKKDYEFFFKCLKKAVLQCCDREYEPNCLVADAASAITNGFMNAFGFKNLQEFTRVTCWQHVKRNIEKHLVLMMDKEKRNKIIYDIKFVLQSCQSKEIFDVAVVLFQKKWENKETEFYKYFSKWWLNSKRNGWYQGFAQGIPDHNNNNETDNKYIKEDQNRKRLGLMQFLFRETNLIHDWSLRRRTDSMLFLSFDFQPRLKLEDWTNSWQWSSCKKKIVRYKKDGRDLYCMPAGQEKALSFKNCTKYFNKIDELSWSTLKEYEEHVWTLNYVSFNKKDWVLSQCSCVWLAKNYYCHYVIALSVERKKVAYKDVHMQIPIGQNRPRGQPKKTASALTKQNDFSSSSYSSSTDINSQLSSVKNKNVNKKKSYQKNLRKRPAQNLKIKL